MNFPSEVLCQGFQYDVWANRAWFAYLESKPGADPDRSILSHILAAQEIWLRRCCGESPGTMPTPQFTERSMADLHDGWIRFLEALTADPVVEYRNTQGVSYRQTASRIARHVIDHGTYHRGELRGLCLARDEWDFPDVGLIGYYISSGLAE